MKFIKFCFALILLPALWGSLQMGGLIMGEIMAHATLPWASMAWFALGFLLWVAAYFALPRPTAVYVFGHELCHAIAVWTSGGKVSAFKVGSESGHIVSDKISAWIALAPYIIPFYPAWVGGIWLILRFFFPQWVVYEPVFLVLWGVAWSFHICFTLSILKTEQSDFASQGYFFSFVVIFFCNWLIFLLLLIYGLGVQHPLRFVHSWGHFMLVDYKMVGSALLQVGQFILGLFK